MLRVIFVYALVILVGLFIEGSVISSFVPHAVVPDVLVVIAVYVALRFRTLPGLLGVFLLGILTDFASAVYVGPNAAGAVAVFFVTGVLANRVYAERIFAVVLISFVCALCKSSLIAGLLYLYSDARWEIAVLGRTIFFEALATACIAPIVVKVLQLAHLRGWGVAPSATARRKHRSKKSPRKKKGARGAGAWSASSR